MPASSEVRSEEGSHGNLDLGDGIDASAFEQILEMDDDEDDREFSRGIVYDFFKQAEDKFDEMDEALKVKDLHKLSELGHFLKGSSATLGLVKVRDHCEKIQHLGAQKSEDGNRDEPDKEVCLEKCRGRIASAKTDFRDAEKALRKFYHDGSDK